VVGVEAPCIFQAKEWPKLVGLEQEAVGPHLQVARWLLLRWRRICKYIQGTRHCWKHRGFAKRPFSEKEQRKLICVGKQRGLSDTAAGEVYVV
jgi:hypothetical protein